MIAKPPEWEIPFKISVYHEPLTPIYRRSLESGLTIGARPGTGRKMQIERTFFRLEIPVGDSGLPFKKSRFLRQCSIWETEISLPIYILTKSSGFFGQMVNNPDFHDFPGFP